MRIENKNILQDCKLLRASVLISLPRTGWRVQEITIIIINKWIKLVKINIEQHKIYFYSKTNNNDNSIDYEDVYDNNNYLKLIYNI